MVDYVTVAEGDAPPRAETIKLHPPSAFAGMRAAGQLAAAALDMIAPFVTPETPTEALDDRLHAFMAERGGVPATLGYRGYPKSCCTSVNHVVCHGIPGPKRLKSGDIVNIDVTVVLGGWHGDTSRMFAVGDIKVKPRRLIDATYEAMWAGITAARPGARVCAIAHAIDAVARRNRFSVVSDFCGHGLGRLFHDNPNIVHAADHPPGPKCLETPELKAGMFFTVEPMINAGRATTKTLADGWTAVTRDGELSAQFEHSVGVTETGIEVFTRSPAGLDRAA